MFGSIGMPELVIILVIALIIFGPRKLPELGRSLGKSIGEFKKASNELKNTLEEEIRVEEQKEQRAEDRGRAELGDRRRRPVTDADAAPAAHRRRDDDTVSRTAPAPRRRPAAWRSCRFPSKAASPPPGRRPRLGRRRPVADGAGKMSFLEHLDELRRRII